MKLPIYLSGVCLLTTLVGCTGQSDVEPAADAGYDAGADTDTDSDTDTETDTDTLAEAGDDVYQWHTFHGGGDHDYGHALAADGDGNVYVVGLSRDGWNGPDDEEPLNAYSGGEDLKGRVMHAETLEVKVRLAKGSNQLLMQSSNRMGRWRAVVQLTDSRRQTLRDLTWQLTNPFKK